MPSPFFLIRCSCDAKEGVSLFILRDPRVHVLPGYLSEPPAVPEKLLWLHVLIDAVFVLSGRMTLNAGVGSPSVQRWQRARTRRWFMDDEGDYVGSFRWICDELDFDHEVLRREIFRVLSVRRFKNVSTMGRIMDRVRLRRRRVVV